MSLRFAFRSLRRSPAYAATSIGTIALTISLAATVFAIVDGVLFKPLPYRDADRLFVLSGWDGRPDTGGASVAALDIKYLSEADPRVRVTATGQGASFINPDRPELTFWAYGIDPAFFDVIGQQPLVGGFTADDYVQARVTGAPTPAIAAHAFWRQSLGGDPAVVGRTVQFGSRQFVIRGVLPRDFVHPSGKPSMLVPFVVTDNVLADRWQRTFQGIVRLSDGITREEARARLSASLALRVGEYAPRPNRIPGPYVAVRMRPLVADLKDGHSDFIAAFAVASLLVMLGAVNVAGLFGARSRDRQRELSIRAALGASPRNLIATLLAESLLIAAAGALAGVVFASPFLAAAVSWLPETFIRLKEPVIDLRVVAFAVVAAIVPVVGCSIVPAVAAMRAAPARRLTATTSATAPTGSWGRGALLVFESAIGIVLVVLGALILTSFVLVRSENAGFDAERLVVVELLTPGATSAAERETRGAAAFHRISSLPGVRGAASFNGILLKGMYGVSAFAPPKGTEYFGAVDVPVSETFFEIAGLELIQGRFPTRSELASRARVAVVSEDTAAAYWPDGPAVGRVLESPDAGNITVVGVVEAARLVEQDSADGGEIYFAQGIRRDLAPKVYLLKTAGDPSGVIQDLALVLRRDVPGVLVRRAESFDQALANSVRDHHARMVMFTIAGGAGLLLLAVGVTGTVASGVARRVREIGIRSALGAQQRQLVRMIVIEYLRPVVAGALLGLVASWWAARLVEAFVYQIEVHEPLVFAAAIASLMLAAAIAAWIPARRASAVDPVSVLRSD